MGGTTLKAFLASLPLEEQRIIERLSRVKITQAKRSMLKVNTKRNWRRHAKLVAHIF